MTPSKKKTLILDPVQVERKVKRMAIQIYEDNYDEKEILLAGIADRGYQLAVRLQQELEEISEIRIKLLKMLINKDEPLLSKNNAGLSQKELNEKVVILVDDVLNSGKTLIYAAKMFLKFPLKKMRTAVLVNRGHHRFPVKVDFSGMNLSTMLKENVSVEIKGEEWFVYLK